MGYYNVLEPCVVGKLHYASVPVQPIEVDDDVAAPLVEVGSLKAYQPTLGFAEDRPFYAPPGASDAAPDPYVIPTEDEVVVDAFIEPEDKPARPRAPRRAKD